MPFLQILRMQPKPLSHGEPKWRGQIEQAVLEGALPLPCLGLRGM